MNETLHERARRIAERRLIRAWNYRQRDLSAGVWYRLRRALVDAAEAWIIDEAGADLLERRGHAPLPVGREIEPPKRIYFVSREELPAPPPRRQTAVRLSGELLQAAYLALLRHPETPAETRSRSP
jgi:hypothetical protein